MEESLYLCADFVITKMRQSVRMHEQMFDFDFSVGGRRIQLSPSVLLFALERYKASMIPRWFKIDFEFEQVPAGLPEKTESDGGLPEYPSPFQNSCMALFHYKLGAEPSVLEYNKIVNVDQKRLNMPDSYRFVKLDYGDVGEARRRALVLALLTYNFKTRRFVTMYSRDMMEQGFFLSNLHHLQEFY